MRMYKLTFCIELNEKCLFDQLTAIVQGAFKIIYNSLQYLVSGLHFRQPNLHSVFKQQQ